MFVDRIYFPVTTLGPGERVVVWTCGCTKRCPGCANPELWETRPEAAIEPARLAAVLNDLAGRTGAHRITFTGGDPLEQAPALASVLAAIRSAFDDILIYTGYTFGELTAMPKLPTGPLPLPSSPQPSSGGLPNEGSAGAAPSAHPEDAPLIDVLIDGPYVEAENDGVIEGRNAVTEALRAGVAIDKIFLMKGDTDPTLGHIASAAREKGIVVVDADRRKLDGMSRTHSHQGVIALAAVREYATVDDILNIARERGEPPLIVVCDELSDPHNLGAVIRTADAAGAHGVIIPKRRSAGLTAVVSKTSAGAVAHVPVARVPNLPSLLKELKEEGVWVFGTAAGGTTQLYQADLKGPAAIVIGSEGDGMGRLVAENCDFTVSIPMFGKINSLNASAAAAVLLYEAVRQRLGG